MGLKINGKDKLKGVPAFKSREEAHEWANGDGVAVLQDIFKQGFDNGVTEFTLDFS